MADEQKNQPTIPISTKEMYVKISNADKLLYEGNAIAVSSYNEKGPFDILPMHANFISIIKDELVVHQSKGKSQEMKIGSGIMKAVENKVLVFLGIEMIMQ
jgi:F0F1-type ATP synthase epsilon subunit